MAYCCNQATNYKLLVDNHNYASSLCQEFNFNLKEIINDLLDEDTTIANNEINNESAKKMLRLIRVGNQPSQRVKKPIDYSTMPRINHVFENDDQVPGSLISNKRKIINENSDETDSSFDYKSAKSKRFKCSENLTENQKQVLDKKTLSDYDDMNEKDLWNLTNKYSDLSDYKELSLGLGLEKNDVLIIESKYLSRDGLKECFYQCLLTWRLQMPENCSLEYFIQVLENNLNKDAEFIQQLTSRVLLESSVAKNQNALNSYMKKIGKEGHLAEFKLEEIDLWKASELMAQEWKSIGRGLNLTELDLANIELKYSSTEGIRECCYQTLILWNQVYYEKSNLEYLCLSLIEMKFNLFAKKMIEQFFKS